MAVQTSAGCIIYIAEPGEFSPEPSWTAIGEVVNIGEFGRVYNLIPFDTLDQRGTRKFKGIYNDGELAVQLGRDPSDDGQAMLVDAVDSDESYLFKLELNDEAGSPATPTTFLFEAMVMSYTTNVGGPDQVVGSTASLQIQSGTITETPAGS